tara:strand:- start:570 stop:1199 length:630 start_codon:yes stop_codon:yes gene_type:complete
VNNMGILRELFGFTDEAVDLIAPALKNAKVLSPSGSIDDVAKNLGIELNRTGSISLPSGQRVRAADGSLVPSPSNNNIYSKNDWDTSWEVIDAKDYNKARAAFKVSNNISVAETNFTLKKFIPTATTSWNLGVFAVVGGTAYRILSIVGSISTGLEETVNNFFGIDCEEGSECEAKGARNQTILGIAIAGVGILSLASFLGLSKKKEQA